MEGNAMITTTTPPPTKHALLADLRRRAEVAAEVEDRAEREGREDARLRASERWWLRTIQHTYVENRPDDALCPRCSWGETAWPVNKLLGVAPVWSCLEHASWLEREAREHVAREEQS
jgi:hypothetical protein